MEQLKLELTSLQEGYETERCIARQLEARLDITKRDLGKIHQLICDKQTEIKLAAATHEANGEADFRPSWKYLNADRWDMMWNLVRDTNAPIPYQYQDCIDASTQHVVQPSRQFLNSIDDGILAACQRDPEGESHIRSQLKHKNAIVEAYRSGDYRFQWVVIRPDGDDMCEAFVVSHKSRYVLAGSHQCHPEFIANECSLAISDGDGTLDSYSENDVVQTFKSLRHSWMRYHDVVDEDA